MNSKVNRCRRNSLDNIYINVFQNSQTHIYTHAPHTFFVLITPFTYPKSGTENKKQLKTC